MSAVWIGVDPGSTGTGVVVRDGRRLLLWDVVVRVGDEDVFSGRGVGVGAGHVGRSVAAVREAVEAFPDARLAVEGVVAPKAYYQGKLTFPDPGPLMAGAMVLGGILAVFPDALVVPPNNHGKGLLASYPVELVTAAERRHGVNRHARHGADVNHARAAWDTAGDAPAIARIVAARKAAAR